MLDPQEHLPPVFEITAAQRMASITLWGFVSAPSDIEHRMLASRR